MSQGIHGRQLASFLAACQLSLDRLTELGLQLHVRNFDVGQALSHADVVPHEVLLLLEGEARVLIQDQGRLSTLCRLGPGDWVGLASFLRVKGCEEVSASSPIKAAVLTDADLLRLLQEELAFQRWCSSKLWAAELVEILRPFLESHPTTAIGLRDFCRELLPESRCIQPTTQALEAVQPTEELVAASNNLLVHELGATLDPASGVPESNPPLNSRLIALPKKQLARLLGKGVDKDGVEGPNSGLLVPTPLAELTDPLNTGLDLGSRDLSRFSLIRGTGPLEEVIACFQMLSTELKLPFRRDAIERILRDSLNRGRQPNLQLCGQLGAMLGLHVSGVRVLASQGTRLQTPALVSWKDGFALVQLSNARGIVLASPRDGWVQLDSEVIHDTFPDGIDLLLLERSNRTPEKRFGLSWFWPALRRYRGLLLQVLVASFVVQLFSLANPLLIQVIIDKVISQRSLDTLQVLGFALVVVTLMEGVLGSLRTFLFSETTNRIDLRLGSEVIDHLLRLPLGYFDRRPVGELGTRIAEMEKIRNFLTGQALTTVLDSVFSVIYVVVMLAYSPLLTGVALSVLPVQIAITVLGAPLFRRQYRDAANQNAQTQSHLVEVLSGIQTVKAQNVEMISRWKWQDSYGRYIARTFEKTITGTALSQASQVLQKLSQLLVLWVGASLVLQGTISLGQLIAFRIISGYVTQPMLRLSGIWQSIQELKVSFERLADVVDTPEESSEDDKGKIPMPSLDGGVLFDNVSFSFPGSSVQVLQNISLEIPRGTFVGIVGQSGSGKSTLTKLLSRLYSPNQGRVLIDGYDIEKVELYSLRRQIGIVPQEPLLFSGTVAENIALTDPEATSDAIVEAATLACAHDFIMQLPSGYSTNVGERGAGLSGGQRQRIALARTLLSHPKMLVLDEATSALDYENERKVCSNLLDNIEHSTVFFVTHRLSTIRRADLIVMMHQGAVVEMGSHDALMALKGRYYALYRQQDVS
ncbi:MAG: peptidase domain-containing ABC transporter [Synechococcus sp. WH 8007]|nr:peptidase domain-containing ABC transporter [Synechococcus sp. WH 8007]